MKSFIATFMTVLLCTFSVRAEEPATSNLDSAIQLVEAMDFCEMMSRNLEEMKAAQRKQMSEMGVKITEENLKDFDRTYQMIADVMDCESMKAEMAQIYAELFTREEIDGLIAFYHSDLGKSLNRKQPEIMRRSMQISMARIQKVMPAIMQKLQQEKAVKSSQPAAPESEKD